MMSTPDAIVVDSITNYNGFNSLLSFVTFGVDTVLPHISSLLTHNNGARILWHRSIMHASRSLTVYTPIDACDHTENAAIATTLPAPDDTSPVRCRRSCHRTATAKVRLKITGINRSVRCL